MYKYYIYIRMHTLVYVHVELVLILRQFKTFKIQNPKLSYLFNYTIKYKNCLYVYVFFYSYVNKYHTITHEHQKLF